MHMKNHSFVAIDPQLECSWKYVLPAKSEYASGTVREMPSISLQVFELIEDFVHPLHMTHAIGTSSTNYQTATLFDSGTATSLDVSRESIRDDTGISYSDFAQRINKYQVDKGRTKVLTLIILDKTRAKIRLKDGDHYISRSSKEAKIWRNKVVQGDLMNDPLSIELRFNRPRGKSSEACYLLTVSTATDIWFEDTEFGRTNRERLSRLLRGLYENLEVLNVEVDSNRFEEAELQALVKADV